MSLADLLEAEINQFDKNWTAGVRKWWNREVTAAKLYPGRVEKTAFLDADAAMATGRAALAAIEKFHGAIARLRDDLYINKGFWQPGDTAVSKSDRRWSGTPKAWREKVITELEGAQEVSSDANTKIRNWIMVIDPKTDEFFSRMAYPEIFKDEDNWNRLVRTFGILVDEAVDAANKHVDRLLRFLSKLSGDPAKTLVGQHAVPDVVDVAGAKLIFDPQPRPSRAKSQTAAEQDAWIPPANRKRYIEQLLKAKALLTKRGMGFLWYGEFYARPTGSAPENHLGKNLGVAANYHIYDDVIHLFTMNAGSYEVIAHELGHRLWFKFLTPAQRAGFASYFGKVDSPTSYGKLNAEEDFAEVFALYIDGRDLTRDQIERFKAFTKGKWKMESLADQLEAALL